MLLAKVVKDHLQVPFRERVRVLLSFNSTASGEQKAKGKERCQETMSQKEINTEQYWDYGHTPHMLTVQVHNVELSKC